MMQDHPEEKVDKGVHIHMSYGLKLGWGGPIGEYIAFFGGPIKEYTRT